MKHDFVEDNIVILSKQTIDLFLKQKNPADLIALYCFYYYTAKWQKTNQPRATISYVAEGLKWGKDKTRNNKQKLIKLGLVEDIRNTNAQGRVEGWYVKIKYLWKKENHPTGSPEGGLNHKVEKSEPNALSVGNTNALSANRKSEQSSPKLSFGEFKKVKLTQEELEKLRVKFDSETETWIHKLDEYLESTGKNKYRSHYATILSWSRNDNQKQSQQLSQQSKQVYVGE